MRIQTALCALTLAGVALASTPASAQTSISLIAISEQGLLGLDLERIENAFRKVVPTLGELEIQPREQTMEAFTEARGLGIDCQARDVECATKIGLIAGADSVLLMRAANKEGSFYLTLLLVDVNDSGNKRVTQWVPVQNPGFERGVEEGAVRLFAPERHLGDLKLRLTPPGATVTLDGKPAPARDANGVLTGLSAGSHKVAVTHAGYAPYESSVQVRFKETSELLVALDPLEEGAAVAATTPTAPTNDPPTDTTPASDDPPPTTGSADAPSPTTGDAGPGMSPLVLGGGIAAGVGVGGVVVGTILALTGNFLAGEEQSFTRDERGGFQVMGIAGIALAVLSGAGVVAGGAALGWGLAAEE